MKEFAERLRLIQHSRNMTQAQLAQAIGVAPGTLSGYLSDRNNPQINDVAAFAQKLGVSIGWLCGEGSAAMNDGYSSILDAVDSLLSQEKFFQIEVREEEVKSDGMPLLVSIVTDYQPSANQEVVSIRCYDKDIAAYCRRYGVLLDAVRKGSLEREEFDILMKGKREQILKDKNGRV